MMLLPDRAELEKERYKNDRTCNNTQHYLIYLYLAQRQDRKRTLITAFEAVFFRRPDYNKCRSHRTARR